MQVIKTGAACLHRQIVPYCMCTQVWVTASLDSSGTVQIGGGSDSQVSVCTAHLIAATRLACCKSHVLIAATLHLALQLSAGVVSVLSQALSGLRPQELLQVGCVAQVSSMKGTWVGHVNHMCTSPFHVPLCSL